MGEKRVCCPYRQYSKYLCYWLQEQPSSLPGTVLTFGKNTLWILIYNNVRLALLEHTTLLASTTCTLRSQSQLLDMKLISSLSLTPLRLLLGITYYLLLAFFILTILTRIKERSIQQHKILYWVTATCKLVFQAKQVVLSMSPTLPARSQSVLTKTYVCVIPFKRAFLFIICRYCNTPLFTLEHMPSDLQEMLFLFHLLPPPPLLSRVP